MTLLIFDNDTKPAAVVYADNLPDSCKQKDGESVQAWAVRVQTHQHIDKDLSFKGTIENQDMTDRRYRNSWKYDDGKIRHGMTKARKIRLNELRKDRNEKLEELDIKVLKALESSQDTTELVAQKQRLRDMPQLKKPELDASQNIDDLDNISIKDL